jgi:penicillin-binding protein 1C
MRKFLLRHRFSLIVAALGLAALTAGFFYVWVLADLPPISRLRDNMVLPSTRFYDRNGTLLYEVGAASAGRSAYIPYDRLPPHCVNAVVATEDANFWSHPGVDVGGVLRALWLNLRGGEIVAGGSTITQQTVRLLLLDPQMRAERTLQRKLKEMVLALRLQEAMSRQEILELYMNQVYLGHLAYGFESGARAYFQKAVSELSLAECALLAGIIQNAVLYDPLNAYEGARQRQRIVLNLMAQNGYITAAQADAAYADDLQFAATPYPITAPHAVMTALLELDRDYPGALLAGGLDVTLTIDANWTRAAQQVVQSQLAALNDPQNRGRPPANAHNAAVVILNPRTGEILTMLGSPDYFDARIDGALNAALALRQPGSALKPFVYALAMSPQRPDPLTAATMMLDVHTPFVTRRMESYAPGNYGQAEHGPVSVRQALASSYNIPAVQALEQVGVDPFIAFLGNIGLHNLTRNTAVDLSIALGGGEVRLLDLAQAYSIFPNGGYRVQPALIQRIQRLDGTLVFQYTPPPLSQRVLDERIAYIITDILADNDARAADFGVNNPLMLGRPVAAKTGTTTDFRDNWVVGYTPDLVVGVWVGNANNSPMVDVTGMTGAGPIFNGVMRRVLNRTPASAFPRPDGLVQANVCVPSGLLPTPLCPRVRREWFLSGTQPTAYDNLYQAFEIDRRTGALASDETPASDRVRQVYLVLPQEARLWGQQNGVPAPPTGAALPASAFRLLAPDPYTVYEVTPSRPAETQQLRFRAAAPPDAVRVEYVLNGVTLGSTPALDSEWWWTLAEGEYALVALAHLPDGSVVETPPVPFRVVRDAGSGPGGRP